MKKWLAVGCLFASGIGLWLAAGLGWLFLTKSGRLQQAELACSAGRVAACREAATAHGSLGNEARGLAFTSRACDLGADTACDEIATATILGDGLRQAPEVSASFLERACESGALRRRLSLPLGILACRHLGRALASGAGLAKDASKAKVMFDAACGDGDAVSCKELNSPGVGPAAAASDPDRARKADDLACRLTRGRGSELPLLLRVDSSGWTLNNSQASEEQTVVRLRNIFEVRENKKIHLFWAREAAPDGPTGPARIASASAAVASAGGSPILLLGEYEEYEAVVTASCKAIGEPSPFAPWPG